MKFNLRAPEQKLNESMEKLPKEQADAVRLKVIEMVQEIADRATFKLSVAGLLNAQGIGWTHEDLDTLAYVVGYKAAQGCSV